MTSLRSFGLIVQSTIGRFDSSIIPCFQLKRGSYVESQGYPRSTSSVSDEEPHFFSFSSCRYCKVEIVRDLPRFISGIVNVIDIFGLI
jgi:hypothetical protein